ncbi:hypothetical protein SAMN05421823_105292 [Catalinimonas alkaloidigena]|uniref:Uncharacterized protein n=1 Tax=Catalinimonas alkaloidigena TaxID=1075417 RepID=A0A1G9JFE2_9BACT|nr:DUF6624 domain-containing protein [Catalinimonas alkaloidigena]SDL35926.1 hypothetical protein SAMN05421823_105292 [Catalinimonas alkaloidigena]
MKTSFVWIGMLLCWQIGYGQLGYPGGGVLTVEEEELRFRILQLRDERAGLEESRLEIFRLEGPHSTTYQQVMQEIARTLAEQTDELFQIVSRYGWPDRTLVGDDGATAFWLLVKGADLEFQKVCVPLLVRAAREGRVNPLQAAVLQDQVLIQQHKKQWYGTQFFYEEETGKVTLFPVAVLEDLNHRRASLHLEPIEDYLRKWQREQDNLALQEMQ